MKLVKGNAGFTLVEVMIAALIMGGIAVGLVFLSKQQAEQTIKSQVDSDINQFKSEVLSILSSPNHCNSNFYGRASGSSVVNPLKTCGASVTHNCTTLGGGVAKFTVNTSNWSSPVVSSRVRVKSMTADVVRATPTAPATSILTSGTLTAVLQYKKNLKGDIAEKTITVTVPVVFNGTTVTGCPKSWNSTNVN